MNINDYTINDVILLDQFNDWRYGEYEKPAERNEVIRELRFHPHRRSHLEIWRKAEEYLKRAESIAAQAFYQDLAVKHRDLYIYAI